MGTNESIKLNCEPRVKLGKQTKALRKLGLIPAVIYGEGMEPLSVSVTEKDFSIAFKQAGETNIVECAIDGQSIPTLISDISIHPVLDKVLHVDFKKINLKKKVQVEVPIEFVGESPAVKSLGGVLLKQLNEIEIECLPQNIPNSIQIDISIITEIGKEIKVGDIAKAEGYTILDESDKVVVSVIAHKEESTETQTERAEVEITTEKKAEEGEAAEGEAAAGAPAKAEAEAKPVKK
ncbi:MAG: 50S ribosomal protein L25 [Patescibacteria group bacterium]